jgi:hypothetical protein
MRNTPGRNWLRTAAPLLPRLPSLERLLMQCCGRLLRAPAKARPKKTDSTANSSSALSRSAVLDELGKFSAGRRVHGNLARTPRT